MKKSWDRKQYVAVKYKKTHPSCELCGSTDHIEVHHLIPLMCGFGNFNLDVEENIIAVCHSCHEKLTPRKITTTYCREKKYFVLYELDQWVQDFIDRYSSNSARPFLYGNKDIITAFKDDIRKDFRLFDF